MTREAVRARRWRGAALWSAVVMTPLAFWRPLLDDFGTAKLTVVLVAAVVVVTATVVAWLVEGEVRIQRSVFAAVIVAVLLAMVVSITVSDHVMTSLMGRYRRGTGVVSYAAYGVLALAAVRHATAYEIGRIIRSMNVVGVIVAGYAILQAVGADPFLWRDDDVPDVFSTLGNANFASAYLGITFAPALWTSLNRHLSAPERRFGIAAAVVHVAGLVVSVSLQGWLVAATGGGIVAFWALNERHPRLTDPVRRHARRVGVVLGLLVLGLVAAAVMTADRLVPALGIGAIQRRYLYEAAAGMIADRPVLGWGVDAFGSLFSRYQPVEHALLFANASPDTPHSVLLGMVVGGGALLGLAYLAFVAYTGWAGTVGLRRLQDGQAHAQLVALVAAWAGYQVQAFISMDEPPLAVTHWVLAGLIVGVAVPPRVLAWRLPWGPTTAKKGKRVPRSGPLPGPVRVGVGVLVILGLTSAWLASIPARADLQAGRAVRAARVFLADPGGYSDVIRRFDRARERAPWIATYWEQQARFEEARGATEAALEPQRRAWELEPGNPHLATKAAILSLEADRTSEAAQWWELAVDIDPNDPATLLAAARFYEAMGQLERAAELASTAASLHPEVEVNPRLLGSAER